MQVSSVINCLALVCYLEAALTHSKVHSIHVDETWVRLVFSCLCQVGEFIFVDWYSDVDFRTSSLSDRFDKTLESRMRIDCMINDKLTLGCIVDLGEVMLVVLDLLSKFFLLNHDVVLSSQGRCVWKTYYLYSILVAEII
jgi:hypothetical protein